MNGESSLHQPERSKLRLSHTPFRTFPMFLQKSHVVLELVASKSRYNLRQEYQGVTLCTYQIKGILRIGQPSKNTGPCRANHSCASRLEGQLGGRQLCLRCQQTCTS